MLGNQHREQPLVLFTTLTQMAVGMYVIWGFSAVFLPDTDHLTAFPLIFTVIAAVLGALLAGGVSAALHLGRAAGAVFSLSNWRNSWLSREALLAVGFGLLVGAGLLRRLLGAEFGRLDRILIFAGIILGLGLVYGISQLYRLRTVPAWDNWGTPAAFFTTTLLTGLSALRVLLLLFYDNTVDIKATGIHYAVESWDLMIILLVGIQAAVFTATMIQLNHLGGAGAESVRTLWGKKRGMLVWRWLLAGAGVLLILIQLQLILQFLPYILLLLSEFMGRSLFYASYRRVGY